MQQRGYNGNVNLRPTGIKIDYTQEQLEELLKCSEDVEYFINNYVKIVSLDGGLIQFKLYDYQKRFVNTVMSNRFVVAMMGRQQGKTQSSAAMLLHHLIFNKNYTIAILANKASQSREIMSRLQLMYEYLPPWLQHGIKAWNKGDIELENGSKAFSSATSASAIRGKSVNMLYLDEFSHVDPNKAEDFFVSSYPTVSSGKTTKIIMTSTPNGYNLFWKFWDGAVKGTNGFVPVKADWFENPNRDDQWLNEQRKVLGEVKFSQEVLISFLGSSNTLVNGTFLSRISTMSPEFSNDGVDILIPPDKAKSYVTCVDVSRGLSGDFSTAVVIDISEMPYKVAAKYKSNEITPLLFPSVIRRLALDYNQSLVLIELNDAGEQVANILFNDLEYENILSTYTERGKQFPTFSGAGKTRPGLVTSKSTKSIGCSQLKILIEETKLLVNDSDILAELSTFIESKGSYAADSGYHDDLVMPLVSFGWLSSTELFKQLVNSDIRNSIYATRQQQIESGLTPFGFVDDGSGTSTYQDQDGFTWVAKGDPDDIRNYRDNLMSRYEHDPDFDKWFTE